MGACELVAVSLQAEKSCARTRGEEAHCLINWRSNQAVRFRTGGAWRGGGAGFCFDMQELQEACVLCYASSRVKRAELLHARMFAGCIVEKRGQQGVGRLRIKVRQKPKREHCALHGAAVGIWCYCVWGSGDAAN